MINIDAALVELHSALSGIKGEWIIIGTSSLYLMGYPVTPNDIDMLADQLTSAEIETALISHRIDTAVKPNEKFRSRFSQYIINGVSVKLMGNLEVYSGNGWILLREKIMNPQNILYANKGFIVPSITDQVAIYSLFGRDKDKSTLQMLANN